MLTRLLALLLILALPWAAEATEYFASPTGSAGNTGLSQGSPITPQKFFQSFCLPGNTLNLMDGIYRGAAYMISPGSSNPGCSGTSGAPVIVRALNDGAAVVDGEFIRSAIFLQNNQWWMLQGFDARNGGPDPLSQGPVWALYGANSHFRASRMVLWDARIDTNISLISVPDGHGEWTDVVLEDMAFFGTGRKQLVLGTQASTAADQVVCRRCWFRWEGNITQGVGPSLSSNYDNFGGTCENCIVSWTAAQMPDTYNETGQGGEDVGGAHHTGGSLPSGSGGIFMNDGQRSAANKCANVKIFGSLFYLPANANYTNAFIITNRHYDSCVTMKHVYALVHPSHSRFSELIGWLLDSGDASSGTAPATPGTQFATNISSVRSTVQGDQVTSSWNQGSGSTGWSTGTTIGAVANPWTNTGAGANLCKRWLNGQPTTDPLWPWPMNARIFNATNGTPGYNGPCGPPGNCSGGRPTRTAIDVTAEIEALFSPAFGPIPQTCKSSGGGPPPQPPESSPQTFPTTGVLDTFTGTGALDGNWTTAFGGGMSRASDVAVPTSGFGISRRTASFNADQEVGVDITALPAEGGSGLFVTWRMVDNQNYYQLRLARVTGAANDTFEFQKVVNNDAGTDLCNSPLQLGFDYAVGDKFGVRAVGTTHEFWYKRTGAEWARLATCTDTTYQSGAFIGFGHGGAGSMDNFFGGTVTGVVQPGLNRPPVANCPGTGCPAAPSAPAVANCPGSGCPPL